MLGSCYEQTVVLKDPLGSFEKLPRFWPCAIKRPPVKGAHLDFDGES